MEQNNPFQKKYVLSLISLFGLYIMLRFQTINPTDPNLFLSPVVWLVASLICVIPLFFDQEYESKQSKYSVLISSILLLVGLLFAAWVLQGIILDHPIKAKESDVIPSLEVYVRRLLAGEKVYTAIPFEGYEVWPTYFPAMWLPYIVPEIAGFDYRWMAFFSFYLSLSYMIIELVKERQNVFYAILLGIIPSFMLWQLMRYDESAFAFSTELMPITFYLWFIWGMYKKNPWLIGIFISLCTMSRYAYTLWIIPFIYVIWSTEGFKYLLKIGLIGISVILIIYIIPFFIMDPTILTDGLAYYGKTAEDQWRLQYWQNEGEIPFHLANGRSMAYWFYEWIDGDHIHKLNTAKRFHTILSFGLALLLSGLYYKVRQKVEWNKYLILSLFVYLCVFYAFLYVPFSYLYMMPLFVGLLAWILYGQNIKIKTQ